MVKAQPYSFNELNGLVITEVLNLHQDEDKGVCLIVFTLYTSHAIVTKYNVIAQRLTP